MIDLKNISGLPLQFKDSLILSPEMNQVTADARKKNQMLTVLSEPAAEAPEDFYYMYRECCLQQHLELFRENDLRYDITILPAFTVGKEFNKTFGHSHPKKSGTDASYPEIYSVLHGKAHFLLQKEDDFIVIEAASGESVIIPSGYSHVTTNPWKSALIMCNIVCCSFKSNYSLFENHKGAMYYDTTNGFVKNSNYKGHAGMRFLKPVKLPELGIDNNPIYSAFISGPLKFSWLCNPEKYLSVFEKIIKR